MTTGASSIGLTISWLFGPVVWAVHFFLLYGMATVLCAGSDASQARLMQLLTLVLTALALAAMVCFVTLQHIGGESRKVPSLENVTAFLRTTRMALAGLATVGILWVAAGAMLTPACTTP